MSADISNYLVMFASIMTNLNIEIKSASSIHRKEINSVSRHRVKKCTFATIVRHIHQTALRTELFRPTLELRLVMTTPIVTIINLSNYAGKLSDLTTLVILFTVTTVMMQFYSVPSTVKNCIVIISVWC